MILAYEPTQGVDVGSRFDIYRALRARTDSGAALLVKSSDPIELSGPLRQGAGDVPRSMSRRSLAMSSMSSASWSHRPRSRGVPIRAVAVRLAMPKAPTNQPTS